LELYTTRISSGVFTPFRASIAFAFFTTRTSWK